MSVPELFLKLVSFCCAVLCYCAVPAGGEPQEALCLSLGGYSHKMKVLLERAVHRLKSFGDSLLQDKEEEEEGQGDEVCARSRCNVGCQVGEEWSVVGWVGGGVVRGVGEERDRSASYTDLSSFWLLWRCRCCCCCCCCWWWCGWLSVCGC